MKDEREHHQERPRNFFAEWNRREKEEYEHANTLRELPAAAIDAIAKGLDFVRDARR